MSKLANKTLLIITDGFTPKTGVAYDCPFVNSQVDVLKDYFKKIIVISPKLFVPKIVKYFHFIPEKYRKKESYVDYKYDNVEVYYPRYLLTPNYVFHRSVGTYALKSTKNLILKKKLDFDLIHCHFSYFSGFVGVKLKEIFFKPVILTIHENRDWFLKEYNSKNNIYKFIWGNCNYIIRVNKKDIPLLKKHNVNTITIPNGFDAKIFKPLNKIDCRKKLNLPLDKKIILNIANYNIPQKNQINLILAINLLSKKRQDFILYLIGKGPDRKIIQDKIKELELEKFVKVLDSKPHNEIPIWMNASDLFVLPSYSESFGIVQIEALGCGIPVVATINGGSEEIIISNKYGFISDSPNDFKILCDNINKALFKNWNVNQITTYASIFNWENVIGSLCDLYRKIL